MTPARALGMATAGCVLAAGLVLFADTRIWTVETVARPAPLPPQVLTHTGAQLYPLLPALALVGLAAAGALLATRGGARVALGILIWLVGIALVAGHVVAEVEIRHGEWVWITAALGGSVALGIVGGLVVRRGRGWPAMGSRYERSARAPVSAQASSAQVWDAIDRGDDPTAIDGDDGPG